MDTMKKFKVMLCKEHESILAEWIVRETCGNAACSLVEVHLMTDAQKAQYRRDRKTFLCWQDA